MPRNADTDAVAEAIVTWVVVTACFVCYILLPGRMSWPDGMHWPLSQPTWGPLKAIWVLLPERCVQDLRELTRWLLVRITASCLVVGAALFISTVTLWAVDKPHEASWCLFSWQALVTCCLTIAEILVVLYPASQVLAAEQAWASFFFLSVAATHIIWLIVGALHSELAVLPAMPMLTHFFSAVAAIYGNMQLDKQRLRWRTGVLCSAWVISCTLLLVTISGWRTSHFALQCACVEILFWERVVRMWWNEPSGPTTDGSPAYNSQDRRSDDGDGSVRSTTKLVTSSRDPNISTGLEDDQEKGRYVNTLTDYVTDVAGGRFDSVSSRMFQHVLELCVDTDSWAEETATRCPFMKVVAIGRSVTRESPKNIQHYIQDVNEPYPELRHEGFDYIRLAFLDGAIHWERTINWASSLLKPGGIIYITDVKVPTEKIENRDYVMAEERLRAHTGRALDALDKAGFQVYNHSEQRSLCARGAHRNGCDVLGAVVGRMKEFYTNALVYSSGAQRREAVAKLGLELEREAQFQIVRLICRKRSPCGMDVDSGTY